MKNKKMCDSCPRQLKDPPKEYCSLGLENVSDQTKGCPWGINSSEYNFCFWNLYKDLQGNPMTDKEICGMLGINNAQLNESLTSAINKLRGMQDTEILNDLISTVKESSDAVSEDNYIYLPDNFRSKGDVSDLLEQNTEEIKEKKPKVKKGQGMPIHRSGKRVDIFGLYSKKTLETKRNEKNKKK